jgi:hypothetical protein
LAKFLASVPKTDRNAVQESYRLLDAWTKPSPHDALEVDSHYKETILSVFVFEYLIINRLILICFFVVVG